jgi:ATP-dependent Clp protease ATP-binding subunit ClpA
MWQRFNAEARQVILRAQEEVGSRGLVLIEPIHLLIETLASDSVQDVFRNLEIEPELFALSLRSKLSSESTQTPIEPKLSPAAKRVLEYAVYEARHLKSSFIGPEHLLLAVVRLTDWKRRQAAYSVLNPILGEYNLDLETLRFVVQNRMTPTETTSLISPAVQRLIERSRKYAAETGAGAIGTKHLYLAMLDPDNDGDEIEKLTYRRLLETNLPPEKIQAFCGEKHTTIKASLLADSVVAGHNPR